MNRFYWWLRDWWRFNICYRWTYDVVPLLRWTWRAITEPRLSWLEFVIVTTFMAFGRQAGWWS